MANECDGCIHDDEDTCAFAEANNAASVGDYELACEAYRRAIDVGERQGEPPRAPSSR